MTQDSLLSNLTVYNEWDPLQSIIVGIADNAYFPKKDKSYFRYIHSDGDAPDLSYLGKKAPKKIIEETNEDLELFCEALKKLGIIVYRPKPIDNFETFKTPFWESDWYFSYCPRDIFLTIDDMIIETPNVLRSRYFETLSYRDTLLKLMHQGKRWICAPKPRLEDSDYNFECLDLPFINNREPIFDAANILKVGTQIFYQISNTANEMGAQWLQSILGKQYEVNLCRNLYDGIHLDTTMVFLRPGLVLVNPERVNKDNLPEKLKSWDVIYAPEMVDYSYSNLPSLSSKWLGMNFLMLNPNLAVVDAHQTALIKLLNQYHIETLALKLRHARTLDGGFHCVTLDVSRKGKLENYF